MFSDFCKKARTALFWVLLVVAIAFLFFLMGTPAALAQQIDLSDQVTGVLAPVNGGLGLDASGATGCWQVADGVPTISPANCASATAGVTLFNGRAGSVTLASSDVDNALNTLSNCSTAGYVYSPASNSCIPASGVTTINSVAGAFTFTGSGVSCSTTTCTFTGGSSISLTTTGTTGAATLASGVLNIPQYAPTLAQVQALGTLTNSITGNASTASLAANATAVDGVAISGTPTNGQIPVASGGTAAVWGGLSFSQISGLVTNAQLTNTSTTVDGQACGLGSSCSLATVYAPLINPSGGQHNYAPLASPTFTGIVTAPAIDATLLSATNYSYPSLQTFGDSLTQGTGSTTFMQPCAKGLPCTWVGDLDLAAATYSSGPTAYAPLLQADYGNAGFNYGRGGDLSTDETWHNAIWAHPTLQGNPMRTSMIGTNDNSECSTNTNCQDTTIRAERFVAANSTIPDTLKTLASTCTTTGTWAAGDIAGSMVTTTSGSTLTCTSTSSTAISYIAYEKCDNTSNGTASVTVNGSAGTIEPSLIFYGLASSSIYWANQTSFASGSGQYSHCTLALARNGGVVGSNTTVITSTNTGRVEVYWVAGPYVAPPTSISPPAMIIGGVPYEYLDAGEPGSGQYNTISSNVVSTMGPTGDGLNLMFANVRAYMNSTTDFTGGTQATGDAICGVNSPNGTPWAATWASPLHPGDSGMCHIYEAFHLAFPNQPRGSQAMTMWAGPSGTISSANSIGGRYGADGGLNAVQPLSVIDFSQTGYGSAVGMDFTVPGYDTKQLRFQGSNNATAALSGLIGLADPTVGVYHWVVGADGTMCFNMAQASGASCNSGGANYYTTFFNEGGTSGAATGAIVRADSLATSNGVAGFEARVAGANSFDLNAFGTGSGTGLAGCFGIYDETTSHWTWNTNATDDLYGYSPTSTCNTGTGAIWSITHLGKATFVGGSVGTGATTGTVLTVTNQDAANPTISVINGGVPSSGGGEAGVFLKAPNLATNTGIGIEMGTGSAAFNNGSLLFLNYGGTGVSSNMMYLATYQGATSSTGLCVDGNGRTAAGYTTNSGTGLPCGVTGATFTAITQAMTGANGYGIWSEATTGATSNYAYGSTGFSVDASGNVTVLSLNPTTAYSAAGTPLPSCVSGLSGRQTVVSDATSPTFLGTYTSGGSTKSPVMCNGTNWVTY